MLNHDTFTLLARPSLPFRVVRQWEHFGIPTVKGITLDGKRQTVARVADVVMSRRIPTREEVAARYPRILRAVRWAGILSDNEALGAIVGHIAGWGGGEAVSHAGGPAALIRAGFRCRRYVRALNVRPVSA